MKHETAREKLLDLAYGELPAREARDVEAHAGECTECRDALRRIRETRGMMAALPPEPAPEEGERILLAAAREAASARRDRRRSRLVPGWLWGGSIAAVAALAVAVVSYRIFAMRPGPLEREDRDVLLGSAPATEAAPAPSAQTKASEPATPAEAEAGKRESRTAAPAREPGLVAQRAPPPAREDEPSLSASDSSLSPPGSDGRGEGAAAPAATAPPFAGNSSLSPTGGEGRGEGAASRAPPQAPAPSAQHAERQRGFAVAGGAESKGAERKHAESMAAADEMAPAARAADKDLSAAPAPQAFAEAPPPEPAPAPRAPSRVARSAAAPSAAPPAAAPPAANAQAAPAADDPVARWQHLRAAGQLRGAIATFPGCDGESWRKVEEDPQGRVVKYARHGTAGGVPFEAELYYAPDGALRVVRYREEGGAWHEARLPGAAVPAGIEGIPPGVVAPLRATDAGIEAPGRCLP
ncbi:anti-sigma factor family protein [Anaeromyxobacter oryzae]|uniref:Putative zinc-finger domain-containing protein n=1 Tax=Anaeromyxobacter oryzae TaxID=2918170 RepID=A0ABN6MU31_9BACT|nr:zf-HC2 domain-containing protein [Anaeromyxobacter oryzae]BDG03790.1 hypothetical protein AMOR_27860 [Anaeromyxobacter oryzae]